MLLTEPLVACMALYASFTYSLIYLTLEVLPIVFREHRRWALVPSTLPRHLRRSHERSPNQSSQPTPI